MRLAARGSLAVSVLPAVMTMALLGGEARAQGEGGPPLLGLDLGRCTAATLAEVPSMVALELHRPVVPLSAPAPAAADAQAPGAPSPAPGATTTVRVVCDGLTASIQIDDRLTGKTIGRVVDLEAAAPVARPHLLALSIVELVAASWIELQHNPTPASGATASAGAAPADVRAARDAALEVVAARPGGRRGGRVIAAGVAQISSPGLSSWGAALSVGGDHAAHVGWLADLTVQHGEESFTLGRVTAEMVSAAGAVVAHASGRRGAVRAGLGVRGGGAWLAGTPADPAAAVGGAVRGRWWGPIAVAGGSLVVRGRVVIELGIEVGRVILPVEATVQGAGSVAIDGTWMRGTLGVGFAL